MQTNNEKLVEEASEEERFMMFTLLEMEDLASRIIANPEAYRAVAMTIIAASGALLCAACNSLTEHKPTIN